MSPGRRFAIAIAVIAILIGLGTAGYMSLAGMSFIEALYMTVITVSTVGFGEVRPLDTTARIFTIGLILSGVGTVFYLFSATAELVLEGRLRDYLGRTAMTHQIHRLKGHVIVCGFGRFGKVVADELLATGTPMVVIDSDPQLESALVRDNLLYVIGDATDDDVLERAGIQTARAIVIGTPSDANNVYITLSAREKNPKIKIHARAEGEAALSRLRLAGADQVISPYQWAGFRMAATVVRPAVVDFLELSLPGRGPEIDLEEIAVMPGNPIAGKLIREIEERHEQVRVVALRRGGDGIMLVPRRDVRLEVGDLLVAIGPRKSLGELSGHLTL